MKEIAYALAGLLLLAAIYFGSYYTMVMPHMAAYNSDGTPKPVYRFGGEAAEAIFGPAFALDRWCRPERWPDVRVDVFAVDVVPLPHRAGPPP